MKPSRSMGKRWEGLVRVARMVHRRLPAKVGAEAPAAELRTVRRPMAGAAQMGAAPSATSRHHPEEGATVAPSFRIQISLLIAENFSCVAEVSLLVSRTVGGIPGEGSPPPSPPADFFCAHIFHPVAGRKRPRNFPIAKRELRADNSAAVVLHDFSRPRAAWPVFPGEAAAPESGRCLSPPARGRRGPWN